MTGPPLQSLVGFFVSVTGLLAAHCNAPAKIETGIQFSLKKREVLRDRATLDGNAPGRIRTCDLRFRKPLLYPLSYEGGSVIIVPPTWG